MVKYPKEFKITAAEAGQTQLVIPEFSGLKLRIERRGIGTLLETEYTLLPGGGFQLVSGSFYEDDVFIVTPYPQDYQYPIHHTYPANRYPHRLIMNVNANSTKDANGNWQAGSSSQIEWPCRIEPAVSVLDGLRSTADGKRLDYSWTIYMPSGGPDLPVAGKVQINDSAGTMIASDTIKRFVRGQLNVRAWI